MTCVGRGLQKLAVPVLAAFAVFAGCSSGDLGGIRVTRYDPSTGHRTETVFSQYFEDADYLIGKELGVYVVMALAPRDTPGWYELKRSIAALGPQEMLTPGRVTLYFHSLTDSESALRIKGLSYDKELVYSKSQEVRIAPRSHSRVEAGPIPVNRYLRELAVTLVFESAGSEVTKPLRLRRLTQDRFPRQAGLRFPWESDPICTAAADKDYVDGCLAWTEREYARAREKLRPLAEGGHASAQWLMGLMHEVGHGAAPDHTNAVHWYRKCAEQESARCQSSLGGIHASGRGVARDYGEAMRLYREAAAQGDGRAADAIGAMYENAQGVAIDLIEAVAWYRRAAEKGLPHAQSDLAAMYHRGRGVQKDVEKARYWWEKAAARGSLIAIHNLEMLRGK